MIRCKDCGGDHYLCPSSEDPRLVGEFLTSKLVTSLGSALSFLETALDSRDITKVRTYLEDCKRMQRALSRLTKTGD